MTKKEIIEKAEKQLTHTFARLQKAKTTEEKEIIKKEGLAQLDMLFFILDEKYRNYDNWFVMFS